MNRTAKILATPILAAALVTAVACGGGYDNSAPDATPSPQATSTRRAATATSTAPAGSATVTPDEPAATPTIGAVDPAPPAASPTPRPSAPAPPPPPAATATTAPPPPPAVTTLTISATSVRFNTASLAAPAGSAITVVFNNNAQSLPHNIQFNNGPSATSPKLAATELQSGPVQQTLTLGALAPGSYYYVCTAHPSTMYGTLTVS